MSQNPVLERLVSERDRIYENIDEILSAAASEERDPSDAEKDLLARHKARADQVEPQIVQMVEIEEARQGARQASALVRARREDPDPKLDEPAPDDGNGDEAGMYRTFAQYARDQLLCRYDYIGATVDQHVRHRALTRLTRAVETVLTTDVPGLVRPQFVSEIAGVINAFRPIVQRSRMLALTSGKIQYPKVTAAPTVAQQVTEKTEAGVGTMTVTIVEQVAKTYISSANFSWQTVTWSNPDALALWFDLVGADYARKTEADAATELASITGSPAVVSANDLAAWTAAIAAAAGAILSATGRYADTIYADVTTGYEILALVSNSSPTFLATGGGDLSQGRYPTIGGLQLVISPQMLPNTVVVGDSDAMVCAETSGAPVELRAVEPSIGGLEVGVIGAFLCEIVAPAAFVELTPPA